MNTTLELYTPENLELWTLPGSYAGAEWPDHYRFLSRNRDSDELTESNFACGLEAIGGEAESDTLLDGDGDAVPLVTVVREGHWACGWVEWIAIHKSATDALRKADGIVAVLENYPVLDENDFSEREQVAADETWKNCYNERERVAYIRDFGDQFEFHSFADLLGCVRGRYFSGYASELMH